jgi:hypothetical protein
LLEESSENDCYERTEPVTSSSGIITQREENADCMSNISERASNRCFFEPNYDFDLELHIASE